MQALYFGGKLPADVLEPAIICVYTNAEERLMNRGPSAEKEAGHA